MEQLSKTEQSVIEMRVNGDCRKDISNKTFRSLHTINTHFQNAMKKTGARDEVDLVVRYLKKHKNLILIIVAAIISILVNQYGMELSKFIKANLSNIVK